MVSTATVAVPAVAVAVIWWVGSSVLPSCCSAAAAAGATAMVGRPPGPGTEGGSSRDILRQRNEVGLKFRFVNVIASAIVVCYNSSSSECLESESGL